MHRYLIILLIAILGMVNSCTEILESEYVNPTDPKSDNYKPTAINNLSLNFKYNEMGIEVAWSDNSEGESGFEIERRVPPSSEFIKVGEVVPDTTSYFDSFIPDLYTHYYYRVKTKSSNGNYSYSDTADYFHNVFSKPTALSIVHQNSFSLKLSWVDRNTIEDGFIINMREPNIQGSNFVEIGNVGKDIYQFLVEGLDTNKIYEFKVTAFNSYYQIDCDANISTIFGMDLPLFWQTNTHLATYTAQFSPVSNLLAVGASSNNISFFNLSTSDYRTTNYTQNYLKFNTAGSKLGILDNFSSANPIYIIDINSLNIDKVISDPSTGFSFSPTDTKIFIWNENDLILRLVDLNTRNTLWAKNIAQIYGAMFNSNGDRIYCNSGTKILILNASDGDIINQIEPQGYSVASFVITDDEKYLYMASRSNYFIGGPIKIWNLETLSFVKEINYNSSVITLSSDQRFIAAGTSEFSIFRTSDFEKVANINPSWGGRVFSLSFNPFSTLISVCSEYDHPKVFLLRRKWIERYN